MRSSLSGIAVAVLSLLAAMQGAKASAFMPYGAEVTGNIDFFPSGPAYSNGGAGSISAIGSAGPGSSTGSTASSSANLSTGIITANAYANGITGSSAFAGAMMWDSLTFFSSNPGAVTVGGGSITLTVPTALTYGASGGACLYQDYFPGSPICTDGPSTYNPPSLGAGMASPVVISLSLANVTLGQATEFSVGLYGEVTQFNSGTANLGDPPNIGISLPTGVTFASASGKFLTGSQPGGTPVPEPAALPLFAIALAALGFTRRQAAQVS